MKYNHPPTIELSLPVILEKVDDCHKVECVKVMVESIMERGIIDEIRELVNSPLYDDPTNP